MCRLVKGLGIALIVLGILSLAFGIFTLFLSLIHPPVIPGGGRVGIWENLAMGAKFLLLTLGGGATLLVIGLKIK